VPGPLITRQDLANGAVSAQPRIFEKFAGKARAARVPFVFPTADRAVGMPHPLGRTPTAWRVVHMSNGAGVVYSPVQATGGGGSSKTSSQYTMSRNFIVLACNTANVYCEVEVT